MSLCRLAEETFSELFLKQTLFIDVRSEGEFKKGSVPGAVNVPILNDQERHLVGLCYKQNGQARAVDLGHELVSGENKEKKMAEWRALVTANTQAVIYCFRGGLRSQITQAWLQEVGIKIPIIEGGHKKLREFFLRQLQVNVAEVSFVTLAGLTGSGKTQLLNELAPQHEVLDLEGLAKHRGSAFGHFLYPQPSQVDFENSLSLKLIEARRKRAAFVVIEDESVRIGHVHLPQDFFVRKQASPVFVLEVPLEERAEHIRYHYVESMWPQFISAEGRPDYEQFFLFFAQPLGRIQKHLGGLVYSELLGQLRQAIEVQKTTGNFKAHLLWIGQLLAHYYDPLYQRYLGKNRPYIVGRGTRQDFKDFLKDYRPA